MTTLQMVARKKTICRRRLGQTLSADEDCDRREGDSFEHTLMSCFAKIGNNSSRSGREYYFYARYGTSRSSLNDHRLEKQSSAVIKLSDSVEGVSEAAAARALEGVLRKATCGLE